MNGHGLLLTEAQGTLPIVVLFSLDYLYLFEYVPQSLRPLLWYVDVSDGDVNGKLARAAREWLHVKYNLATRREFIHPGAHFMIYGPPTMFGWFIAANEHVAVRSIKANAGPVGTYVLAEVVVE
jgi:hypothetical protein